MKLLIFIGTPILYLFILAISTALSILMFEPSVSLIGGITIFGAGDVNAAIIATVVDIFLFSLTATLLKSSWKRLELTLKSHLWRCFALYLLSAYLAFSILNFLLPSYKNPGIGGLWAVTILFSALAGILADRIIIPVAVKRTYDVT